MREKPKKALVHFLVNAFNKAYINNGVALLSKAVIPNSGRILITALEPGVKRFIEKCCSGFLKAHLMHAQMVQKNYSKMKGPYIATLEQSCIYYNQFCYE